MAEYCKQQLVQQHTLFKQQTAALAAAVQQQVQLANHIPVYIEENGSSVRVWNPLEVIKAEIAAAQQGQHSQNSPTMRAARSPCIALLSSTIVSQYKDTPYKGILAVRRTKSGTNHCILTAMVLLSKRQLDTTTPFLGIKCSLNQLKNAHHCLR